MRKGLFSAYRENRIGQQFNGVALRVRRYRAGYDYEGSKSQNVHVAKKICVSEEESWQHVPPGSCCFESSKARPLSVETILAD